MNARRLELKSISKALRPLVKAGKFSSTNAALLAYYQDKTGQTDFRMFGDWKKAGSSVKKGETGFPIWGTPRRMSAGDVSNDAAALAAITGAPLQGPEFFPVCYLFHAGQVEAAKPGFAEAERMAA